MAHNLPIYKTLSVQSRTTPQDVLTHQLLPLQLFFDWTFQAIFCHSLQAPIQKLRDSFAFATSTLDNMWLVTHFDVDLECSTTYVNQLLFPTEFISKCRHSEQSSGRQEPFNCHCERLLVSLTSHNFCLHLKITLNVHKVSFRRKTVLIL